VHWSTLDQRRKKDKAVSNNRFKKFPRAAAGRIIAGSLAGLAVLSVSGTAFAQDNRDKKL
jgi:hypothetical protein